MNSGQTPKGGPPGGGEQQDMFLVPAVRQSIPPIDEVPETQEEKRERKLFRLAIAVVVALLIAALATAAFFSFRAIQRSNAIADAEQAGTPESLQAALGHLEGGGASTRATRARLLAELAYGGVVDGSSAREIIKADAAEDSGKAERVIAAVYLALEGGEARQASTLASPLVPTGDLAAEAARARALAAAAVGNLDVAVGQAKVARDLHPDSPRHGALYATVLSFAGDPEAALGVVSELALDGTPAPSVQLARGLAQASGRTALSDALKDVEAVESNERAALRQRAWAALLVGRIKRALGDAQGSREALARAAETTLQGDERFMLDLAAGYIALGEREDAARVLEAPAPDLAAPGQRKQLRAAALLLAGNWEQAGKLVASLRAGPEKHLLEARLHVGQAKWDQARQALAKVDDALSVALDRALLAARTERGAEQWSAAEQLLRSAHETHPDHPEVIAALADTLRQSGKSEDAKQLLAAALEGNQQNPFLLASRAREELAEASFSQAYASMTAAVEHGVRSPDLWTELAQIARRLDKTDEARKSFQDALSLQAKFPEALTGLLALEIDDANPEAAMALVERVDAAALDSLEVAVLRGRAFVLASRGAAGAREVRKSIRRHGNHGRLYRELGHLYFQAEEYDNSSSSYTRALRALPEGERDMELELLQALSYARARRAAPAERILEDLPRELPEPLALIRAVVQGRIYLIDKQKARVRERGRAALRISENAAAGLLLMADDARSRDQYEQELEYLKRAAAQVPAPPEAFGRLAQRSEVSIDERCAFRKRYLSAAPRGSSAQTLRQRLRSCP